MMTWTEGMEVTLSWMLSIVFQSPSFVINNKAAHGLVTRDATVAVTAG